MARILFLDDDPLSLKMFSKIMELSGHEAVTTSDADEALTLAASRHLDLMFTDFQMPAKDGLEVIKALREQEETHRLPVFVVSANADDKLSERVLEAGGQGFLRKPLRLDALLVTIQNCLEGNYS
ncbi:MAG TPA: response regulator [Anaerolineales bacterium]|nr:response regulator [Anaerolineales bacterium]